MRSLTILAIAVATAVSPLGFAQKPETAGAVSTAPGQAKAVSVVKATATVEAIDAATRTVTLKMPKGDIRSLVASEEVRNFDQIKVGDKVNVAYVEALTIELKKGGKAVVGRTESTGLDRSAPGQKPGGVAHREVTMVADIVGVDAATQKVSLKGAKGDVIELPVRDPEQFKLMKKGDQIQATYTEALAIKLEPAAPAPAPKKAPAPASK